MKTYLKILIIILIIIAIWLFVRFVIGGPEDDWICVDGQWVRHGAPSAPMPTTGCGGEDFLNCVNDTDCIVFGQDGDCNCGCFNKNYDWQNTGACFCAAPASCKCVSNKCEGVFEEALDVEEFSQCAEDGDTFSTVIEGHLDSCCEGLKEWIPIPDTRLSIADVCYEIGPPSESNIGICIKCGDGVCGQHPIYDENPCNCPEDCKGKNKSHFTSIEEFCQSNDWKISLAKACEETFKGFPICELCAF